MSTAPINPRPMVDSLGAARRLQGLACIGYGTHYLADQMVAHRLHVRAWQMQHHDRILVVTHQRIDYTYQRLWEVNGPSKLARDYAEQRGWLPPDAWTDNTIDDPLAYPYGDPAQADYIDEIKLARVKAGKHEYLSMTGLEKLTLLAQHLRGGGTLRGFRNRYRPVPKRELCGLVQRHEWIWPLLDPDDLQDLTTKKVRLEDLRLVG